MSPPEHNVLTDPDAELGAALKSHAFGIESYALIPKEEHGQNQVKGPLQASARVMLLKGEGELVVVLSQDGYSLASSDLASTSAPHIDQAYESLDALLIAVSPAYVAAMQDELAKRFETPSQSRFNYDHDDGEEVAWID